MGTVLAMKKEDYLKELDLEDLVKKSNNRSEILKGLEGKRSESKDKEKLKNIGMAEKFISTYLDENGEILKKGRAIELRMYDHIDMVQRAFDMKGEGFATVLRDLIYISEILDKNSKKEGITAVQEKIKNRLIETKK